MIEQLEALLKDCGANAYLRMDLVRASNAERERDAAINSRLYAERVTAHHIALRDRYLARAEAAEAEVKRLRAALVADRAMVECGLTEQARTAWNASDINGSDALSAALVEVRSRWTIVDGLDGTPFARSPVAR
jgi:hypothetical protein